MTKELTKELNRPRSLNHLKLKAHVAKAIRTFFDENGLEEVFSPLLVSEVNTEPQIEYFQVGDLYLIASPELGMKEHLFAIWQDDIEGPCDLFQLGPVFRAGVSEKSPLHENEYLMVEYYHRCLDLPEGIRFFLRLISHVFTEFKCLRIPVPQVISMKDLFFQRTGMELETSRSECLFEALKKFNPASPTLKKLKARTKIVQPPPSWNELFFEVYVSALEPWLSLQELCVLTHFPRSITSMARPAAHDSQFVDRFEVLFRGVELCNGYIECFHPVTVRTQMELDQTQMIQRRPLPKKWLNQLETLWSLKGEHLPTMCGVALGVERLCLFLTQHQRKGLGNGIQPFIYGTA